jgi:hypothetical protein
VSRYRPQRNWGARVLDYRYKGLKTAWLSIEGRERLRFSLHVEVIEHVRG